MPAKKDRVGKNRKTKAGIEPPSTKTESVEPSWKRVLYNKVKTVGL